MKFLFLATALFALYGSVVCDLPAELYGLGFIVQVDDTDKTMTKITLEDGTIFKTGRTTDTPPVVSMVNMDAPDTELVAVTTPTKMGKSGAADDDLVKTYDLSGVKVTVDLTVEGCTTLTNEAGNAVTIDITANDPDVVYTNKKNSFALIQVNTSGTLTYKVEVDGAEVEAVIDATAKTITVGTGDDAKVYDLNGDDPTTPDDPCVTPTTTCIDDPCTSSYGWNQWCVPSYGYKYGFRTGGCYRRRSRCYRRRSRCYSFPSYYC